MYKHEECLKNCEHNPKGCMPEQIRACHGDIEVEEQFYGAKIRGDVE